VVGGRVRWVRPPCWWGWPPHDGASAIGKWVMEREDRGWRVTSVEPQVVVKATGALEAWAHVCVAPVR
jgi:hypothetical protein